MTGFGILNVRAGGAARSRGCLWPRTGRARMRRATAMTADTWVLVCFMVVLPSSGRLGLFDEVGHGPVLLGEIGLGEIHDVGGRDAVEELPVFQEELPVAEQELVTHERRGDAEIGAHGPDVGGVEVVLDLLEL